MTTTQKTPSLTDLPNEPGGRVVVGVDGSPASLEALKFAAGEARLRGSTLEAICAWQYPQAYGWAPVPEDFDPESDMERTLAEAVATVESGTPVDAVVVQGQPADVLLNAAIGAELLVVGSRGRGGFSGLLLGSVSQQCVHHATCPVVVVPATSASRGSKPARSGSTRTVQRPRATDRGPNL